jgi:hypothetical protein
VKGLWFTRRAIALHVVIVIVVPTFAALCIWQIHRALAGNDLSWAYVFEWPFFAGYAIFMWWRFVHDVGEVPPQPARAAAVAPGRGEADEAVPPADPDPTESPHDRESDPEAADRAAYNRYLRELAAQDKPKQWR